MKSPGRSWFVMPRGLRGTSSVGTIALAFVLASFFSWLTFAADLSTVGDRIASRDYPSVFQAWNQATAFAGKTEPQMQALHDLVFLHPTALGLRAVGPCEGESLEFTAESRATGLARRRQLLRLNSAIVILAEIRYRDAPAGFLPDQSPWWKRTPDRGFVMGWAEGGYRLLDVGQAGWREQVARRAKAVMETGCFDGIMLDWWVDDADRQQLVRAVRRAVGPEALILVNANDREIPGTAAEVNGLFMECYRSRDDSDWQRISRTLLWAERNLREPRINCVESWHHHSRRDLNLMRAVTTLALTHADGYCLFSDPNDLPTPDHLHDWYDFWDKGLGRPVSPGRAVEHGAWRRAFSQGEVVYNPCGGREIEVRFETPHRSRMTGRIGTSHVVKALDGDIFIRP